MRMAGGRTTSVSGILTIAAVLVLTVAACAAPEVWVAPLPAGDDGNPGTQVSPFATLAKGVAEVDPGGVIHVGAGTFVGTFTIDKDLSLQGAGVAETTIRGTQNFGLFIEPNTTVTLSHLTIGSQSGTTAPRGIRNSGTVSLNYCAVKGNYAEYNGTAGIDNQGMLTLVHTTVSGNSGDNEGGGIGNSDTAVLINSTISGNTTEEESGGGIWNVGSLTMVSCTITGNSAHWSSGGVGGGGVVLVKNSIIAGNTASNGAPDFEGELTSHGYNLIEDKTGCTINEAENPGTNITGQDPLLGPLQNNGGPTETHALLLGSPAIDAGSCTDIAGNSVATDQRGFVRHKPCDIGAFEYGAIPPYGLGDVNGDAIIDLLDVRLCAQIAQGIITGTPQQRAAADVDGDGDVDMDDAQILAEFIIRIRTTLP